MKNKMIDLNNHLFMQIERLGDEDLTVEKLEIEVKRADAIVGVSQQIIENANLALKAAKLVGEYGTEVGKYLPMIEGGKPEGEPRK